jgi:alkylation response protein AidB-like acyl-CoA dehydrogenase
MNVGDPAAHEELRQLVRGFLRDKSPSREVRRLTEAEADRDDAVWAQLAGQLGLTGIAVPERYGGAGYGPDRHRRRLRRLAFTHAAKECIQIHGGIGYTWEHDAHLYLRRAKSSQLLLGPPAARRARLAELTGI